jgi:hypothetical protein
MNPAEPETELSTAQKDRRAFLATAGKLAVGVPPTLIVLLSTSMSSPAIAQSSGNETSGNVDGHAPGYFKRRERYDASNG